MYINILLNSNQNRKNSKFKIFDILDYENFSTITLFYQQKVKKRHISLKYSINYILFIYKYSIKFS